MRKLYISVIWIGWLAGLCSGNGIIYGKPGGLMQPPQPSSSVVTPTVKSNQNNDELFKGAETSYGPYGHAFGGHGQHDGGDLAVVVTGGYKVSDSPHQHHGHGGFGGHHGGHLHAPHGHGLELGHGIPLAGHGHGIPVVNHAPAGPGFHGIGFGHGHQHHGQFHEPIKHHEHGIAAAPYVHHQPVYKHGYGHHIPSHGLIGHNRHHGAYHHPLGHAHGGFKPILGHGHGGYGIGHHPQHHGYHHQGHGHHGHGHHQLHHGIGHNQGIAAHPGFGGVGHHGHPQGFLGPQYGGFVG